MLVDVRQQEKVLLYENLLAISAAEEASAVAFLRKEYDTEKWGYPHNAPSFNAEAALWAAKLVYRTAQLILYRKQRPDELDMYLTPFPFPIDASAILSADIILRFMPDLLEELDSIDPDDELLPKLREVSYPWSYSLMPLAEPEEEVLQPMLSNPCAVQLLIDRIWKGKHREWAQHPQIEKLLKDQAGMYGSHFLKNMMTHDLS